MSGVQFEIKGFQELAKELEKLPQKVARDIVQKSLQNGAKYVAQRARESTLFEDDTGELRSSIKVRKARNQSTILSWRVVTNVYYAHMVEFGYMHESGKHIPARPFMRAALDESVDRVTQYIASDIKKLIDKVPLSVRLFG